MTRTLLYVGGLWCGIGIAFALGMGLGVLRVLAMVYLVSGSIMFLRYRTSAFGRKWIPRLLDQYAQWPPLVRLRRLAPPLGGFVAKSIAIGLAAHVPLLLCLGAPEVVIQHLIGRGAIKP